MVLEVRVPGDHRSVGEGEFLVGRSQYDSPEVDTEILIETDENPSPGTFLDVKITEAGDYDLYGKFV